MDFKEATDALFPCVTHARLAERLGCSLASIRQARLPESANAYRNPPPNWREGVKDVARERRDELSALIRRL